MKKTLSILLILFIVPCVFVFNGCVKSTEEVAGTYKLVEIYSENKTYKVDSTFNDAVLSEDSVVLTLNKDEDFSASYKDLNIATVNGKWEKKENIILFVSTGLESLSLMFELKSDGSLLLVVDHNAVLLLEKRD